MHFQIRIVTFDQCTGAGDTDSLTETIYNLPSKVQRHCHCPRCQFDKSSHNCRPLAWPSSSDVCTGGRGRGEGRQRRRPQAHWGGEHERWRLWGYWGTWCRGRSRPEEYSCRPGELSWWSRGRSRGRERSVRDSPADTRHTPDQMINPRSYCSLCLFENLNCRLDSTLLLSSHFL